MERVFNVGLRGGTLLAKFSLIFFLAYFLEPRDVALYGLFVVTISYSLFALGFDFYSYSTREILGRPRGDWANLLKDQGVFFLLVYTLVLPLILLIFVAELIPWRLAPWFFCIVILEHVGQELNRFLVAASKQLLASVILFLRSGLWALIIVAVFWWQPGLRSLEMVLFAWMIGAASACVLGGFALRDLDWGHLQSRIDWRWIRVGVKVALPLLIATLAIRGVFTIDRYWIQHIAGENILAAYVLFAGIANAVISFLDAGVFVFQYPKIISAYKEKDVKAFDHGVKSLFKQTLFVSAFLCVAAAVMVHPLLVLLDNDVYAAHVDILYILLMAIFLNAVSMVPHYGIYALSRDRGIILSHLSTLCAFLVLGYLLSGWSHLYGIPLALCGAFGLMLVQKTIYYRRCRKQIGNV